MILVGGAESSGAALLLPVPVELWTAHDGHELPVEGQGNSRAAFKPKIRNHASLLVKGSFLIEASN